MSNEAASLSRVRSRPRSRAAGWADEQIREQLIFTAGRIVVADRQARRAKPKRANYVLCYRRDYPLTVVEARANITGRPTGCNRRRTMPKSWGFRATAVIDFENQAR
jgi:type I restriction enzyme, R subunit